jgi:hypothetical protein
MPNIPKMQPINSHPRPLRPLFDAITAVITPQISHAMKSAINRPAEAPRRHRCLMASTIIANRSGS